ncbi:MAG: ABC transporter ATP-binding protein [Candidatus Woesearchaeota archaeon]
MKPIIEVQNIAKTYKVKQQGTFFQNVFRPNYRHILAVNSVSFSIQKGEMVGFIGPNGAGKTTTIKMLCGVLHADTGEISINNFNPFAQRKEYLHHIGAVFGQKKSLWPELSVLDNLELIGSFYKLKKTQVQKRIAELTRVLGEVDFLYQPFRKLSLGQQMKSELIASLLHRPKILFLDEPTIGMDILAKLSFIQLLKELNQKEQITVVLTSHDLHEIENLCKRIIVITHGTIVYDGDIKTMKPEHVRVTYVSRGKLIEKTVEKKKLKSVIAKLQTDEFSVHEIPLEHVIREYYQKKQ